MRFIFADNAWLGPGQFVRHALIGYDDHIREIRSLDAGQSPPASAMRVSWLTPGFINAHCHLEYSRHGLADALPRGSVPFGEWMAAIVQASIKTASPETAALRETAMREACDALISGGCTSIIDSTTDGSSAKHFAKVGLRHFLFFEVLGLSRQRAEPMWRKALEKMDAMEKSCTSASMNPRVPDPDHAPYGLNPHAPYSVGPWLREQLVSDAAAPYPQAWHLGETPDEEKLFRSGNGSIAEFLASKGMPMPYNDDGAHDAAPGVSAFQFLQNEHQLERCRIAFHGNTLSMKEATYFTGDRALVHCPATSRWFKRAPAPLKAWLDNGVNVCLGTDSLASSDTLSMLEIVRMTLRDNPDVSSGDVLRMACANPTKLSLSGINNAGALNVGAPADMVAFSGDTAPDWRAMLSSAQTVVKHVVIGGEVLKR